jgi:hypothetical protein
MTGHASPSLKDTPLDDYDPSLRYNVTRCGIALERAIKKHAQDRFAVVGEIWFKEDLHRKFAASELMHTAKELWRCGIIWIRQDEDGVWSVRYIP